jgi:hypothetical protein
LTFYDLIGYSDTIVARKFQGLSLGDPNIFSIANLTSEQMKDIDEVNKWAQIDKYTDDARAAWMTKILSGTMLNMQIVM